MEVARSCRRRSDRRAGALDAVVDGLSTEQWQAPTPSPGWTVADQIGHLAYFDAAATLAMTDPDAFQAHRRQLMATFGDVGDGRRR